MLIFDKRILADHLDTKRFGHSINQVPISWLKKRDHGNELEQKILKICILSCTNGNGPNVAGPHRVFSSNNAFGAKRQKIGTGNTPSYNRFFLIADLTNPPHCAAIMPRTNQEAANLMKLTQGDTFVGSIFCIYEPDLTTQTVGATTPVLALNNDSLLPCKPHLALDDTTKTFALPRESGETNYFVFNNKTIRFQRISLARDVSCSGVQCDRQKPKGGCTCMHQSSSNSLVYSCDVIFEVPARVSKEEEFSTFHFRSLRTTSLFFKDYETHANTISVDDQTSHEKDYRNAINKQVEYINNKGGWTIVGWFMLGSTTDASSNGQEKVINEDITLHLSYLYPTDDLSRDEHFKKLKIGDVLPPPAVSNPPQTLVTVED
jgi:Tfp pilus assembly major pilin PilA